MSGILKKVSATDDSESGTAAEIEQTDPAPASDEPDEAVDEATRARFLSDLIERGEVVEKGEDLPAGATHELEVEDGKQILHRRRFSAY